MLLFIVSEQEYPLLDNMVKVILPICTLNWRVNNYFFRQGNGLKRRKKILRFFFKMQPFHIVLHLTSLFAFALLTLIPLIIEETDVSLQTKINSVFTADRAFPSE